MNKIIIDPDYFYPADPSNTSKDAPRKGVTISIHKAGRKEYSCIDGKIYVTYETANPESPPHLFSEYTPAKTEDDLRHITFYYRPTEDTVCMENELLHGKILAETWYHKNKLVKEITYDSKGVMTVFDHDQGTVQGQDTIEKIHVVKLDAAGLQDFAFSTDTNGKQKVRKCNKCDAQATHYGWAPAIKHYCPAHPSASITTDKCSTCGRVARQMTVMRQQVWCRPCSSSECALPGYFQDGYQLVPPKCIKCTEYAEFRVEKFDTHAIQYYCNKHCTQ